MPASRVQDYYVLTAESFLTEVERARTLVSHGPTLGSWGESLLRGFLSRHLPQRWTVGQGFVRSTPDLVSRQIDVLVWDSLDGVPLWTVGDFVVLPPGATAIAVEVKLNLNTTAVKKTFENCREFRTNENPRRHIAFALFSYGSGVSLPWLNRAARIEARAHHDQGLPDLIVALKQPPYIRTEDSRDPSFEGDEWYRTVELQTGSTSTGKSSSFLEFYLWLLRELERVNTR
jgi:hypothetical protein